jgi:hypothetical protein
MSAPSNPTKIKRLLRVVSIYRCYFQDFASKAIPMCKLLKKDDFFVWIKACAKSWEWMKASITCLLVLIVHNWKLEFHVHTNASNFALGAMLSQNPNKTINRPIYYVDRLMNNAKNNYTTTK